MWWGVAAALVLTGALLAFYIFAAVRLQAMVRSAPGDAKRLLFIAIRGSLAQAAQKVAVIVTLLFVASAGNDDNLRPNLWWILLILILPVVWMLLEGRQLRIVRSQLDSESQSFLDSLDKVPTLPWKKSL